jgi:ABC-2 type transport system permease protein
VPAPAVWVVVGATVARFGVVPRAAAGGWGVLGACVLVSILGPLLGLPECLLDLSPFHHEPQLPAGEFAAGPLLVLCAVAAALTAAGLAAFRRRDLAP